MSSLPVKIEQPTPEVLRIEWSDGQAGNLSVAALRDACPCASCREKRRMPPSATHELPVLTVEETQPTRIAALKPVGNYAYAIHFSDGHDTGIFTLDFLRSFAG